MTYKVILSEFPEDVIIRAYARSGHQCQLTRKTHDHSSFFRWQNPLIYTAREKEGFGAWEAYHIDSNGPSEFSNCEILCISCHKLTQNNDG